MNMIKKITLAALLMGSLLATGQSLPFDFETNITTSNFVDFDGGVATVLANPQITGMNTSANVAEIVRNGGQIWAGSKIVMANNLDFTSLNTITMLVFTSAPIGAEMKVKLEGNGAVERVAFTSTSSAWELLSWDFTGVPTDFNTIAFMFDFGNVGDGSATSTFYFDDVQQIFGGTQMDLPVDFEGNTVNYATVDFGGTNSSLIIDPTDATNSVIEVIKTATAATWAGTTIGTAAGFATNIPLTLIDSKMSVKVWSPVAGTPVRLKIEDSNDPTHTCETETNTTLAGAWETLVFDFSNEAPGTAQLSVGLGMGWTYNMASVFFNFGTDGATAGEQTYYFDDVVFGGSGLGIMDFETNNITAYPNPTTDFWQVESASEITSIEIIDMTGKLVLEIFPKENMVRISASGLTIGTYTAKIYRGETVKTMHLLKQ